MRVFVLSILLAANLAAQGALDVVAAYWGVTDRYVDVTNQVKSMVQPSGLNIAVAATTFGFDPVPGQVKNMRVYYRLNGQFTSGEWRDGMNVQIAASGGSANITQRNPIPLRVTNALYGKGGQVRDVTSLIQSRLVNNTLAIPVNNDFMGGDPAVQQVKDFTMSFEWQGVAYQMFAREGDTVNLPDGSVIAAPVPAQGVLRIVSARYGLGNRTADVTALLQGRVNGTRLSITADNNSMGGDPGRGDDKQLVVVYEFNGQRMERRVNEGQVLNIP